MSTLTSYTSGTRPSASANSGLCIFRSDTNAIEVSDGTDWQTYNSDGVYLDYSSGNTHSGDFDGNDYAVGTVGDLNSVSAFSTSCWFRYQGTLGGSTHIPLSGAGTWYVWVKSTTNIEYATQNNPKTFTIPTINDSTWYHLVTVHDGTNATLYLDGSSLGTQTVSSVPSTAGNAFNIGRFTSASYYWNGWIDEVSVFNRALTSTEVTNIYSNKTYLNPTAIWRLNNDTTDELGTYDLTNNTITFDGTNKAY